MVSRRGAAEEVDDRRCMCCQDTRPCVGINIQMARRDSSPVLRHQAVPAVGFQLGLRAFESRRPSDMDAAPAILSKHSTLTSFGLKCHTPYVNARSSLDSQPVLLIRAQHL